MKSFFPDLFVENGHDRNQGEKVTMVMKLMMKVRRKILSN